MAKKKFYVVMKGRKPGIYREWFGQDGAEAQISGFPGAVYKGFPALSDAEHWFQSGREPRLKRASVKHATIGPSPQAPVQSDKNNNELRQVTIYTDGACIKNPGRGGYGVVVLDGKNRKELSGGFRLTTNNRMEIMAAIAGLQALDVPCIVTVYSDSKYLVDAMTLGWVERWRAHNWQRSPNTAAVNPDLWEILLQLCAWHRVKFVWLRGHAGNSENERCDRLAVGAAQQEDLPPDRQYEAAGQTA
jgi:ribonuclease HI